MDDTVLNYLQYWAVVTFSVLSLVFCGKFLFVLPPGSTSVSLGPIIGLGPKQKFLKTCSADRPELPKSP